MRNTPDFSEKKQLYLRHTKKEEPFFHPFFTPSKREEVCPTFDGKEKGDKICLVEARMQTGRNVNGEKNVATTGAAEKREAQQQPVIFSGNFMCSDVHDDKCDKVLTLGCLR